MMTVTEAVAEVEALLLSLWVDPPKHAKASIHMWEADQCTPAVGVRVAEVSLSAMDPETGLGGGSSAMQSDPDSMICCFCAERAILDRTEFGWDGDAVEDRIEADFQLIRSMYGDEVADAWAQDQWNAIETPKE